MGIPLRQATVFIVCWGASVEVGETADQVVRREPTPDNRFFDACCVVERHLTVVYAAKRSQHVDRVGFETRRWRQRKVAVECRAVVLAVECRAAVLAELLPRPPDNLAELVLLKRIECAVVVFGLLLGAPHVESAGGVGGRQLAVAIDERLQAHVTTVPHVFLTCPRGGAVTALRQHAQAVLRHRVPRPLPVRDFFQPPPAVIPVVLTVGKAALSVIFNLLSRPRIQVRVVCFGGDVSVRRCERFQAVGHSRPPCFAFTVALGSHRLGRARGVQFH